MKRKNGRVLGIWDVRRESLSLGGLLILVEEMKIQSIQRRLPIEGICFVTNDSRTFPGLAATPTRTGWHRVPFSARSRSPLLDALLHIQGIRACYVADSLETVRARTVNTRDRTLCWPPLDVLDTPENSGYAYGTTSAIQRFKKDAGYIPFLSMKPRLTRWAVRVIERDISPQLPVVVHLQNNPRRCDLSNANFKAWIAFFKSCHGRYPVRFLLIGGDALDPRLRALPNVVLTQDRKYTLDRDLAFIPAAYFYMGMASGPCAMALFSDVPYVIYKNPDHHPEKMALELGSIGRFSFASPLQKLLRVRETYEGLKTEFEGLYQAVSPASWRKRVQRLQRQAERQSI